MQDRVTIKAQASQPGALPIGTRTGNWVVGTAGIVGTLPSELSS